jgi:hypothetical protein
MNDPSSAPAVDQPTDDGKDDGGDRRVKRQGRRKRSAAQPEIFGNRL